MDSSVDLLKLRRRMGWTSSDLARHLKVSSEVVESWEKGGQKPQDKEVLSRIQFLLNQADICNGEVKSTPIAENILDASSLDQIDSDRVNSR